MSDTQTVPGIYLGALSDPLKDQLEGMGLRFINEKDAEKYQRAADSWVYLKVHGFVTDRELTAIGRRITREIWQKVEVKP